MAVYAAIIDHPADTAVTMRVLVPYRVDEPKTRLASVLDRAERREFSRHMLTDVLGTIQEAGYHPTVLSTEPLPVKSVVDERPLTVAVNSHLEPGTAVVMADLALITPDALSRLLAPDADVVLVPGRGGGTNAIVAHHPRFRVDYHGLSYRDHVTICEEIGADVRTIDSYRLGTDIDEPDDLAEVLLHGNGTATDWLDERFELSISNGRVGVERS